MQICKDHNSTTKKVFYFHYLDQTQFFPNGKASSITTTFNFSDNSSACNFSESNAPPWVCFTIFKLYKWYHIAQSISYIDTLSQLIKCNFIHASM